MPQDSGRKLSKVSKLAHFTLKDQKVVIRYLFQQEVDSSEAHKLISAVCGETAPSYKDVRDWYKDLAEGREEVDMCVCDGGRKKSGLGGADAMDPALVTRVEFLINKDYRITLERLSENSISSIQTVQGVVSGLLNLKRVGERWVPRIWTPEQRTYRMSVCQQLLDIYAVEGNNFLSRIIVGDESFVLYHKNPNPGNGGKFRPAD